VVYLQGDTKLSRCHVICYSAEYNLLQNLQIPKSGGGEYEIRCMISAYNAESKEARCYLELVEKVREKKLEDSMTAMGAKLAGSPTTFSAKQAGQKSSYDDECAASLFSVHQDSRRPGWELVERGTPSVEPREMVQARAGDAAVSRLVQELEFRTYSEEDVSAMMAKKDELLARKDELLASKDDLLASKDDLLAKKDEQLAKKVELLAQQGSDLLARVQSMQASLLASEQRSHALAEAVNHIQTTHAAAFTEAEHQRGCIAATLEQNEHCVSEVLEVLEGQSALQERLEATEAQRAALEAQNASDAAKRGHITRRANADAQGAQARINELERALGTRDDQAALADAIVERLAERSRKRGGDRGSSDEDEDAAVAIDSDEARLLQVTGHRFVAGFKASLDRLLRTKPPESYRRPDVAAPAVSIKTVLRYMLYCIRWGLKDIRDVREVDESVYRHRYFLQLYAGPIYREDIVREIRGVLLDHIAALCEVLGVENVVAGAAGTLGVAPLADPFGVEEVGGGGLRFVLL